MRTCRLETLGCKVNQYETQQIKVESLRAEFREAAESEPTDLCIVNTCTVTENADSRGRQVARLPNAAFSTDLVVGFPGETDEEFAETLDTCRPVRFLKIHVFPFSRRRGIPAATLPHQIAATVKKRRCQELTERETERPRQCSSMLIGGPVEVLVEGFFKTRPGLVRGTDCRYATVELPGNSQDFWQLVTGQPQRPEKCELVANRYSAPNQASVFASDCLESPTTNRATKDCAVQNSPA